MLKNEILCNETCTISRMYIIRRKLITNRGKYIYKKNGKLKTKKKLVTIRKKKPNLLKNKINK